MQHKGLIAVHARAAGEGVYVLVPPTTTPEEVVRALFEINQEVRRKTHFDGMNQNNRARVQFRYEPFTVAPTGDEKPALILTTRFSRRGPQHGDDGSHAASESLPEEELLPNSQNQATTLSEQISHDSGGSLSLDSLAMIEPSFHQMSRVENMKFGFQ